MVIPHKELWWNYVTRGNEKKSLNALSTCDWTLKEERVRERERNEDSKLSSMAMFSRSRLSCGMKDTSIHWFTYHTHAVLFQQPLNVFRARRMIVIVTEMFQIISPATVHLHTFDPDRMKNINLFRRKRERVPWLACCSLIWITFRRQRVTLKD